MHYLFIIISVYFFGLVCTSIPHLCARWNWEKTAGSKWTCFGVRVARTLDYPTVNLNLR